jgi:hypothetical protein
MWRGVELLGDQEDNRKAGAGHDDVFTEAMDTVRQLGSGRRINIENSGERASQFAPVDFEYNQIFEVKIERIALLGPIAAYGDDLAAGVMDHPAWTAGTAWARAPNLLDEAAGRSQMSRSNRPFIFKDSLPFQAIGRRVRDGLEGGPHFLEETHPARSPGR